ncbi:MAG: amidohydrolase family protein [Pseudohongiellaceae bacterium]
MTEDTLNVMKARNVYVITTRAVGDVAKRATLRGAMFFQDELIRSTTPPWMMAKVAEEIERLQSDNNYAQQSFDLGFHQQMQDNLARLFEAGIPLVAGTDNDGLFIGDDLHFELELLVDAGLTPLEAITTATKNAALLMENEEEWGTLEAGKRADILLVNGRPDKNISDTRKIELVIQKGRVLDRERLVFDSQTDMGIRDTNTDY